MRRARWAPEAHRKISEHRRRTRDARLHRRVLRGARRYREWMLRTHGFVDGDWVRVIAKYDIEFQPGDDVTPGRWTYSQWKPAPDGDGWIAEFYRVPIA